jgi:PhnB protein
LVKTNADKNPSTVIIPYLNFFGNTREAMTFYKECLGGELTLQTVEDSPVANQMPAEMKNLILHSQLVNGSILLMAADAKGADLSSGNTISLMLNCKSETEVRTYFANLSVGVKIEMPLEVQFWGSIYATLTDKFGIKWRLNYDRPK